MTGFDSPGDVFATLESPGDMFMDHPKRELMNRKLDETGEVTNLECRLYRRQESPLWVSIFANRRIDPVKQIPTIYGFALNITQRKEAENALRENERQLRRIISIARLGNWKYDLNTDTVHTSYEACQIFGTKNRPYTLQEIKEMELPEYREPLTEAIRALVEDNKPYEVEFKVRRPKDGKVIDIHSIAEFDSNQNIVFGTLQDVTQQRDEERKRKKLEEQLKQSQKMESIGLLAGGIAHDFNNLLTGIAGNISLAQMDTDPEDPMYETFTELLEATDRSKELVRQLLAFSRKQIIVPKVLDINKVLRKLEKLLVKLIGEDVELRVFYGQDLPPIKADRNQIEHLLVNLAVNARDAMPEGGSLTLETSPTKLDESYCQSVVDLTPGPYVQISVSDTGEGIEKENLEKIFDPFFTTKPMGEGTGLGLSSAIGTVKQHKGHLQVYSEIGKGTTFKIFFPATNEASAPKPRKDSTQTLVTGGNETILLVEDDPNVCKMTHKALEQLGYRVLSATNGEEALKALDLFTDPIDLLLTDVVMPGMNGRLLAQTIKHQYPDIFIIFMSGYTENVITRQGILEEGVNFISKPFTPSALASKIRRVLDKSRPEDSQS